MSNTRRSFLRNTLHNLRKLWRRRRTRQEKRQDKPFSPRLEFLESRQMFNADPGYNFADDDIHIHADLTVLINGDQVVIPKGVGNNLPNTANNGKIHTHDFSGKIHIHPGAGRTSYVTLGEFFTNWRTDTVVGNANATLTDTSLLGNANSGSHIVRMYVNGTLIDNAQEVLADYKIDDGEKIVLSFEPIASTGFPSFDPIANQTVLVGAPTLLGIDGFDPNGGPLTYEVDVDNDNLLTATLRPTTNKSMQMTVENFGVMTFQLFDDLVPGVTNHLKTLINQGDFNDSASRAVTFYRIANTGSSGNVDFVIQGGPTYTSGNGLSSLGRFDDEFDFDLQHTSAGILSMAKSTDDTNDAQFFVTGNPTRFLDFNHSVFGILTDGEEVRKAIQDSRQTGDGAPPSPIKITKTEIIDDTENAALMLKALPGASGTTTVTVTVRDALNNVFTQTFTVTVQADTENNQPFLDPINPVSGPTGQDVNFTLVGRDVEGDAIGYRAKKPTSSGNYTVSVNKTSGQVTVTPGAGFTGTAPVEVQAYRLGIDSDITTLSTALGMTNPTIEDVEDRLDTEEDPATLEQLADLRSVLIERDSNFDQQLVNVAVAAVPTVELADASDSGVSNTDNITRTNSLDFNVTGVTAGATVKLFRNGTLLTQGVVATGATSITLNVANAATALGEGTSAITATETPAGGSESGPSAALSVVFDTTSPGAFTSTAPTAALVGFNLNYDAQNPDEGTPGFRYSLTGAPTGAAINPTTGVVTFTPTTATTTTTGPVTFTIVATDAAGNTTPQEVSLQVTQPRAEYLFELTTPDGTPLTSLAIGQDFVLHVFVNDLRPANGTDPRGMFAAFLDVLYDSTKATVTGAINHGTIYPGAPSGSTTTAGLIDEAGGVAGSLFIPVGLGNKEVFSVPMRATAAGVLTFTSRGADLSPDRDTVAYDLDIIQGGEPLVTDAQIHFGATSIEVSGAFNAVNDTFPAQEDSTTNTFNPLTNDASIGGAQNTLTITAVGTRSNGGAATITDNGTRINYVPALNFVGTETFTYTVRNQNNEEHTATISVNVADTNDAPVATADTASVPRNSTGNVIDVLANDNDGVDTGETLRVTAFGTGSAGGTISIGPNGTNILYTPAANFSGTESFTYTISDRTTGGLTATGTVTVSVSGLVANNDSVGFTEDSTGNEINPLANDAVDPQFPSGVLTITTLGNRSGGGSATISTDGKKIIYAPALNFQGIESFTYTISDGLGHNATATISVNVTNVNDPPTGVADTVTAFKNTTATFDVLANDSSAPDPTEDLTIDTASLVQPTNGTVSVIENGKKISYTPLNNVVGATSFTYRVRDAGGQLSAPVTVNVTVQDFVPGSLAGFVYFDVNNNGIKDAGESPLTGVTITLTGTATSGGSTAVNRTAKTGTDGSYSFDNVAPGNYTLAQTQPAFTIDGRETAGSQGGTTTTNDRIVISNFASGTNGTNNNFGERGRTAATISLRDFFSSNSRNFAIAAFDSAGGLLFSSMTGSAWDGFTGETFSLVNNNSQLRVQATNGQSQPVFTQLNTTGSAVRLLASNGGNTFYRIPAPPKITLNPGTPGAAPTAVADTYSTTPGTALSVAVANGVLKNDTDPENNALTAAVATTTTKGKLTLNANGSFNYTPNSGFTGTDSFTYRANDGINLSGLATVTINVTTTNAAPTGVADNFNATEDQTLSVTQANGVLKNDADPEGATLAAAIATQAANGTVSLAADGSFTYIPTANFFGTDSFTYRASDGNSQSGVTTVTLTVAGVNDAPIVSNDTFFPKSNATFTSPATGVLANDSDADTAAGSLTVTALTQPTNGSLTLNPNGSFTYTPTTGFTGNDTFTYRVSDGAGGTADGTVTLTVNPNAAPSAANDTYSTVEDTPLVTTLTNGVLKNDTDLNNDPLTAQVVGQPANGSLSFLANGTFTYTPNSNFVGTDSFTYQASDGTAQSNTATVSITVTADNDAPNAVADEYVTTPGVTLTKNAADGVLKNDIDSDGPSPLTAILVSGLASGQGTLSLAADGSFTYTPPAGFHDSVTFTYKARDAANAESAAVTVTIVVNSVPVAANDSFSTDEDTPLVRTAGNGVLVNDNDADSGDTLTAFATVTGAPANGDLVLGTDGGFTYTPDPNFNGTDSFTYIAKDGLADSAPATVTITVNPINDPPTTVADSYVTGVNTALTKNAADGVLKNDTDPETPTGLTAAQVVGSGPTHGTLSFNADGSFTYTPENNFTGNDSFTYTASDGTLTSNAAIVTIKVNAPPTAANDPQYTATEDTPLTIAAAQGVLVNDSDVNGDTFTAVEVTGPANGTLTLAANGGFTYTPDDDFVGTDSFTYRANDGNADSAPATVTITVAERNDPPVAVADSFSMVPGGTFTSPATGVLANDTDEEGNPLTAVEVTQPANGSVTLNTDGSFTYTPTASFHGTVSFTYKANDGTSSSATAAIVTIVVNNAPQADNDTYPATEDTPLTIAAAAGVLANDEDADDDDLTADLVAGPANGTLDLNDDGSFDYSPNLNFNGADSFTYVANDGFVDSAPVTVTINVAAVNDLPQAANDTFPATEDTPLSIAAAAGVLLNDTDADGDPRTVVHLAGPANGTLTLHADGSFDYSPNLNFSGADSFTYVVNDTFDNSAPATVTINVAAVNDAPVAAPNSYTTDEDVTLVKNVTDGVRTNDSDADNDALTVAVEVGPAHGTLSLAADGSFSYIPTPDYNGSDSFSYKLSDGSLETALATVTLTITSVNDVPQAVADEFDVDEDETLTIPAPGLLANDTNGDGLDLTTAEIGDVEFGSLTVNADGSFDYTPDENFAGVDSFTYKATDGTDTSAATTVTITVNAIADAPTAGADSYNLDTNQSATLTEAAPGVLSNDDDGDGDDLTAIEASTPDNGVVTLNIDGSFVYTPNSGFTGTDSFTYQASDGTLTTTAIVTINVSDGGGGEGEGALAAALWGLMADEEEEGDWSAAVDAAMAELDS
jgi:VCBS repeat-containing protein